MLRRVLLIDDNSADNFLHRLVLEGTGMVEEVLTFQYAEEALDFLKTNRPTDIALILLDINMPRMNGFEFLEAYQEAGLDPSRSVIVMLTTSLNPNDMERAHSYSIVKAFLNKPLTEDRFLEVVSEHLGS